MGKWPPKPGDFTDLYSEELFTTGRLTLEDRKTLVEQAILLLDQIYVNRTIKQALHGVDPILRLMTLRHQLEELHQSDLEELERVGIAFFSFLRPRAPEVEFHREMTSIFSSLRDRHTHYFLPKPFRDLVAFLPFDVETVIDEEGVERYIVARVRNFDVLVESLAGGPQWTNESAWEGETGLSADERVPVEPGWKVFMWNNQSIEAATRRLAAEHAGSNPAAQIALGLERLTVRPLIVASIPQAPFVSVVFQHGKEIDQMVEVKFQWLVTTVPRGRDLDDLLAVDRGLDPENEFASRFRYQAYAGSADSTAGEVKPSGVPADEDRLVVEKYPERLTARRVRTRHGEFGYIRIYSFADVDPEEFVEQFVELLSHARMPQNGLILDVRGNGGGIIPAAESILQLLTPHRIEPEPFQFLVSPLTRKLTRFADGRDPLQPDLSPWRDSVALSMRTGTTFSSGVPITPPEQCNDRGQVYYGPSVLIIDAKCYSAGDMFVAGYRDHHIGPIVGTDENTGAGGANVWQYNFLAKVLQGTKADESFPKFPRGPKPDLSFAIRRSLRVGSHAGIPLEDLGVRPDYHYRFSATDVLERNRNLIEQASELLVKHVIDPLPRNLRRLRAEGEPEWPEPVARKLALEVSEPGPPTIRGTVSSEGIDRLDVYVDGRPEKTLDVEEGPTAFEVPRRSTGRIVLKLMGYARQEASNEWGLVAAKRVEIEAAQPA